MNILSIFQRKRTLQDTMRPDPDSRDRRMANWSRERQQRYLDAAYGTPQSLRRRANALPPATSPEGQSPNFALPGFE